MDFKQQYAAYQQAIEQYLEGLFSQDKPYGRLQEAMRYSILGGGKRIRPVLTLEFARLGGIDWHLALPYACALELVHNYSLIHDDLPCMDDDDLRRGQPTTHKKFGETLAVLAGDALQPEAFRLIAEAPCMSDGSRVEAVRVLARACGADGMVAGQVLDTLYGIQTEEQLKAMYRLKTGVMISGAAELGCVAADMPADMRAQAVEFADQLGLAFQIRDDMLDVVGDEQVFGKPIGSDKEEGKITYVDVDGLEGCARAVEACTRRAKDAWPSGRTMISCSPWRTSWWTGTSEERQIEKLRSTVKAVLLGFYAGLFNRGLFRPDALLLSAADGHSQHGCAGGEDHRSPQHGTGFIAGFRRSGFVLIRLIPGGLRRLVLGRLRLVGIVLRRGVHIQGGYADRAGNLVGGDDKRRSGDVLLRRHEDHALGGYVVIDIRRIIAAVHIVPECDGGGIGDVADHHAADALQAGKSIGAAVYRSHGDVLRLRSLCREGM